MDIYIIIISRLKLESWRYDRLCSRYITTLHNQTEISCLSGNAEAGQNPRTLFQKKPAAELRQRAAVQCGPGSSLRQLWSEEHDIAVTTVETLDGGVMYNLQPEN